MTQVRIAGHNYPKDQEHLEDMVVHNVTPFEIPKQRLQILDLPPELIIQISSFLPVWSTSAFALCNKGLSIKLSQPSWNFIRNHKLERIKFLTILSRDLPFQHACNGCGYLHYSSTIPRPADLNARERPDLCIPVSTLDNYQNDGFLHISNHFASYKLCFAHVQLALKRYTYGSPHGLALQDLSYSDMLLINHNAYFFTVEARIDDESDELLFRAQEWIVATEHPREEFLVQRTPLDICRHLATYHADYGFDDSLTPILRCRLSHDREKEEGNEKGAEGYSRDVNGSPCPCMQIHQCQICATECRFDVIDLQGLGKVLCVTTWLNLGSGLTAEDPMWTGHSLPPDDRFRHGLPRGRISSRYESQEGDSVEEITGRNREMLQAALCVGGNGQWIAMRDGGLGWRSVGGEPKVDFVDDEENVGWLRRFYHSPYFVGSCLHISGLWVALGLITWNIWKELSSSTDD